MEAIKGVKHTIEEQLILHEGLRLEVYKCPAGHWTVGVGRNLEVKGLTPDEQIKLLGTDGLSKDDAIERLKLRGITKSEALFLLDNDVVECKRDLESFAWFKHIDPIRQKVLIDMRFNLGSAGFRQFKKMITHLEVGNYADAADEMVNSAWYHQVGTRAHRLVEMMRTGEDYTD